jgi:hypothetical protein
MNSGTCLLVGTLVLFGFVIVLLFTSVPPDKN